MTSLDHPFLYQFAHPWHWLTYGQNASGVQALMAGVATIAAIGAAVFAGEAYRAARNQVELTRDQLKLAHRQFEGERAKSERARQEAYDAALTEYEQRIVLDDAERPRFVLSNEVLLKISNRGLGTALDVRFLNPINLEELGATPALSSGQWHSLLLDVYRIQNTGLLVTCRSVSGSQWRIVVTFPTDSTGSTENVSNVERGFRPPKKPV